MRLLLYAPNYLPATRYGGPVRSSHGLATALVERGHEVHVVTTNVDGPGVLDVPLDRPVELDGVSVRYFPIRQPKRIYYAPEMARAVLAEIATFDVVHTNGMFLWPGPRIARIAIEAGVPLIVSPRGMLMPEMIAGRSTMAKRAWIALLERGPLRHARAVHVTSQEEADGIRRLGLDLAPLATIGNGVTLPQHAPTPEAIERIWSGAPRGHRIAFLGRLDWTKGVELAIDAAVQVPGARLLIAGPDQICLRAALDQRLMREDGSVAGRFIGPVEDADKWALLIGADVLVAPSLKESFGISVAEAMAIGTPVICTEGVGLAPTVQQIDPACVVPREVNAIASALCELLSDSTRRKRFSARAKKIMLASYTWPAIAQQMESVYCSARSRSRGGATLVA